MINIEEFFKTNKLFDGHYKLIRPLSTDGGTADVWLAIDTNTIDSHIESDEEDSETSNEDDSGMLVAIKIYRPKNALDVEGEQRFRDEYKIVFECRHANLLQPTGFAIFEDLPYLVLPYCKYGSSEQLIGKKQTDETIWKFILDVASGLHRLHSNEPQIIHQDIKPANVLIDNSKNFAITDFGISSKRGGGHGYYYDEENSGTLAYMAPERFQEGTEPIAESDIWAFGATLCEILTGKVPFGEEGGHNQISKNMPMPAIPNVSADIQRLIHSCLSLEPGNRPSAAEIEKAAIAKQFPIKSKKWILGIGAVLSIIILAVVFVIIKPSPTVEMSKEEAYEQALLRINSRNIDTLNLGIKQMDSLCNLNYIPALYEMAITYGLSSDSDALIRKEVLNIEVSKDNMPVESIYNEKAINWLIKIHELNDSSYPSINAKANYRLAVYYWNESSINKRDKGVARGYLNISKSWADMTDDTTVKNTISAGFEKLNN